MAGVIAVLPPITYMLTQNLKVSSFILIVAYLFQVWILDLLEADLLSAVTGDQEQLVDKIA